MGRMTEIQKEQYERVEFLDLCLILAELCDKSSSYIAKKYINVGCSNLLGTIIAEIRRRNQAENRLNDMVEAQRATIERLSQGKLFPEKFVY
jgi:hypothetical protein